MPPIYEMECNSCQNQFDVYKRISDFDRVEHCPECDNIDNRIIIPKNQMIDKASAADWSKREYNPAFGEHLTPNQARKKAKEKGLIEVGTESKETIAKYGAEVKKRNEENRWKDFNLDIGEIRGGK